MLVPMLCNELICHCGPREKMLSAFFSISRSCFTISNSRLRRRTSSRLRGLMSTAWEGFGAVLRQLLAALMDRRVRNAQFTGYVRNRLPTGLSQSHRLPLKLGCVGLLNLLHDPFSPSGIVYSKISLLHNFGVRSPSPAQRGRAP